MCMFVCAPAPRTEHVGQDVPICVHSLIPLWTIRVHGHAKGTDRHTISTFHAVHSRELVDSVSTNNILFACYPVLAITNVTTKL